MRETVWKVDRYVDSLKERDAVKARKEHARQRQWRGGREEFCDPLFQSRDEAVSFMLERAQKELEKSVAQVKHDQRRITKIRKKYL